MLQGMTSNILKRIRYAKIFSGSRHVLYRDDNMVCSIVIAPKFCSFVIWTFGYMPLEYYIRLECLMSKLAAETSKEFFFDLNVPIDKE